MKTALIVAMANNHVIGFENKMPWHIPEELQYFKSITLGKPIIMGRNTWESLGKALPGRMNIVITSKEDYPAKDAVVVDSIETAIEVAKYQASIDNQDEIMIIGGASIYQQSIELADTLYITKVNLEPEGDAFFPEIDESLYDKVSSNDHVSKSDIEYSTLVLQKK